MIHFRAIFSMYLYWYWLIFGLLERQPKYTKMRSKIQNLKPIILSISLITLTCILAYARIQNQNIWEDSTINFDILFILVYLLWIIFESRISIKEKDKGNKTSDYGTLEFYAISQACTFLSALWFNTLWLSPNVAHFLGFIVFNSQILSSSIMNESIFA